LLYRWCIQGRWKLLLAYDGKISRYQAVHKNRVRQPQLFDLQADPFETKNLAANHPELVEKLSAKINRWWQAETPPAE